VPEELAPCNPRLRFLSLVSKTSIGITCEICTDFPNQYLDRTLSIEIDEGQHKKQIEVKKAKEKAAVGKTT
jgi:sodium/potassium-transporting ATPase subunit alpha